MMQEHAGRAYASHPAEVQVLLPLKPVVMRAFQGKSQPTKARHDDALRKLLGQSCGQSDSAQGGAAVTWPYDPTTRCGCRRH